MTDDEDAFDPSEYNVTITRTFDAPREQVWQAWTDPDQVAQWWGPKYFTVSECELDVRPGGRIRIDMQAPDGTIYPDAGVYHEVDEPERLMFTSMAFKDEDGNYQLEARNTVTFVDRDGTTEFTLEAEVTKASPEVAQALQGMELGWSQSFGKLATFLSGPSTDGAEVAR